MVLEFDCLGVSQRFEALDHYLTPYVYTIRRIEHRERFETLTGPITEIETQYRSFNETTGDIGPGLTLAGAQALVNAREKFKHDALVYIAQNVASQN